MKLACEERVYRTIPVNLAEEDVVLFENEYSKVLYSVESMRFRNVLMLSNGALIKHKILTEVFFNRKNVPVLRSLKLHLRSAWCLLKSKKTIKLSKGMLLTDHFSEGFFHWFGDVLQKLESLSNQGVDCSQYTFLIPGTFVHNYIFETLQLYGLRYLVIDESSRVQVDDLFYVPQISPTGNYRAELMRSMKNRFVDYYQASKGHKRIYITREKASKRKIINESILIPILKKYDFQIVAMEDLTFREQYKLISESSVLVGLHGAGLTHMLWLGNEEGRKGRVLEIRAGGDASNNCFYSLASDLNVDYYYCLADTVNNKTTQLADFKIDPEKLEKTLVQMIGSVRVA